jgi:parvulin-like peptidyl-prolyl isomerase
MTFRAKPAVKRTHRPAYEVDHRRTLLLNIGFGVVVLLALLILGGAAFASWYGDHLAALANVNGQAITKDDFRDRAKVETFRLDYLETRIRERILDGRLSQSAGDSRISAITQQRQTLETTVIEDLIDATLQAQLATKLGVTVTDQQINDALLRDATTPESRHLWVIGIKPAVSTGQTKPTDQQKADAKAKAAQALADIKAGKAWSDVAKQLKDDLYSSTDGDAGWVTKDSSVLDVPIQGALFKLPVNGVTDVMEGTDGLFRIGRVTEIEAEATDPAFQQKLKDQGIDLAAYKKVSRASALQLAINDKLVADVVNQPTAQRHVAEIFIATDPNAQKGSGDEVQVRHILYSPKHDPQGASSLPATDPAWKTAQDQANAAYAALQKDPTQFIELAKTVSDDTGTKADGGLLPYYSKANLDKAFADAIFKDGLTKNQLLPPVKSAFGWHVIQFLDRRKQPSDRMADIQAQASATGADFAALAKANSEASNKDKGGDAGWIAKYQLDSVREIAIFKAPVGGLTDVITTADGITLYKILTEEQRMPDATQIDEIRSKAFTNWYTAEKNAAKIEKLFTSSQAQVPAVP